MKKTGWIALVLIVAHGFGLRPAWSAEPARGQELQRILLTHMLLDKDPDKSRLGARIISRLPNSDVKQSLTDLTAEHLIALADPNPALPRDVADVIGWHVNVLATNVGRYRAVLNEARQRHGDPRTLNRINAALLSPDAVPAEEYQLRNIDIAPVKAEVGRQFAAGQQHDRSAFTKLPIGTELPVVLTSLGLPNDITSTTFRIARRGRAQMFTLNYVQGGMVVFRPDEMGAMRVYEFVDEPFDVNRSYFGERFGMAQAIAGLRGSRFRDYLIYNSRTIIANPEFLPVLEQRMVTVTQPADKFEADAMVRCLDIIYRYGSLEAMDALRRIAKGSTDERMQRHAQNRAAKLELRSATETESDDEPEEADDESVDEDVEDAA